MPINKAASYMKKMELLVPAGGPETLKTAILYGADAIYLGGEAYGLRAKARNFTPDQLAEGIAFAHSQGVRVYVTVNIIGHNAHLEQLPAYLKSLYEMKADAVIMADAGMIRVARQTVPELEIHLSTQAGATNYETFRFWADQGIHRIVAARELSLEEIAEIRARIPEETEIEAFVHGAMCISVSGRCLLSQYLSGRSANLGACTHPCRWKYALMEESRPGEYFPIAEDEEGSYILNSRDLCMVEYLPQLRAAGLSSLKIEGRMKTPLYVAMTAKIYREALDDLMEDPDRYEEKKPYYRAMLELVSHREYTTGFYLGKPDQNAQVYDSADYVKKMDFVGKVLPEYRDGRQLVEQRGKFSVGDTLYLLTPRGPLEQVCITDLWDEQGGSIDSAPHAQQKVLLKIPPQTAGTILMKSRAGELTGSECTAL